MVELPRLTVVSRRVLTVLLGTIVLLVLAHGARSALLLSWPPPRGLAQSELLRILDIGGEAAAATWFTIAMLLAVVAVAVLIAVVERRAASPVWRWWAGVAVVFTAASIDEQLQVHEMLVLPMRSLLGITSGPFWLAWVVPALILVVVLALLFAHFVVGLPARTRAGLIIGIGVWLTGAIGVEMIDAATFPWRESLNPVPSHLISATITAVEESMEMLGIALVLHTLLVHVRDDAVGSGGIRVAVR
ncbi:MAG: hypothetical protein LDL15_05135 [Yonghaparkia sp.]|nr:hypothetical protein [Microcella sp.]